MKYLFFSSSIQIVKKINRSFLFLYHVAILIKDHIDWIKFLVDFFWLQASSKEQTRLNHNSNHKEHRKQKDASSSSTYSAFRQWRRGTSMGSNRSNSVGSSSTGALTKLSNDPATIQKMEQFPLVLSDTTMPEEDLSLKFLALV